MRLATAPVQRGRPAALQTITAPVGPLAVTCSDASALDQRRRRIPRAEAGRAGLSAWEVSSATHGLRAQTLICGILARLATSDRQSPVGLIRSGTQQARRAVAACLSRLRGAR